MSEITNGQYSRVEKSTVIVGEIKSKSDIRIDGSLDGNVETEGKVIIGKEGKVKGTIMCQTADVEGQFNGKLWVADVLSLKSTSDIEGKVTVGKLMVELGAKFNASCTMKSSGQSIKSISKFTSNREKTA